MGYCYPYASHGVVRRYISKDERIQWLNDYQAELEKELQAVKERIEDIQAD